MSEREKLADEILKELMDEPLETIGHIALIKIGQMAINTNSEKTTTTTEIDHRGHRYKLTMLVTWEKLHKLE